MEFARHKKRRRRAKRPSNPYGAQAGRAFLALVMIAGIVYFISASAAGTWLAEKVVVPVFAMLDEYNPVQKGEEPAVDSPSAQLALNDTKKAIELEVNLPAVTCFAVQTGVYASPENAQTQAALLQSSGAAGYVLQDGNRYRVLSEAYANEAEARSRKDQRLAQGQDCTLYAISTNAASYRVSALEEQIDSVNAGFCAIAKAQQALTDAARQFEAGTLDAAGAQSTLKNAGAQLQSDMSLLSEYEGEHGALFELLSCYRDCLAAIEKAGSADALPVLSSEIKYAQLYVTDRYKGLMEQLAYAGSTPSAAS